MARLESLGATSFAITKTTFVDEEGPRATLFRIPQAWLRVAHSMFIVENIRADIPECEGIADVGRWDHD